MTNYFTKNIFLQEKNVLLLKYTMLRICRISFFRLDENMVEIHVDSLAGFEQSHLHVEFHQKVIEPWVGVESEHIARRRLVFHVFMGEFLYGASDCVARFLVKL